MELVLIRHGLPLRVENEQGVPADPPLSETGRTQAERLARWLRGEKIAAIYSSTLRRAHETAIPLARATGLEIRLEPGIVEFDGDSEVYIPIEELKEVDYGAWKQLMATGSTGLLQDLIEFKRLVVTTIERFVAAHPGERIAIFCHGGVINAWGTRVLGMEQPYIFQPDYTSINRFLASSAGHRSLHSLNETAHLRD